ncbi:tRNA N6-adenosine threonylcarbamoyltransferase [bioreactor metagenome]|uniref:N(6)-L-threonylcarbamoyladenine synthase n=1 Tax=bioreactor metagenome TaxID=1076179 RepID=A0A645G1Y1_9ZZZZ
MCLIVSGGHSHIVLVKDYCDYMLIGHTRDDAAGETFDKIARVLGLPYPGGPNLEKLAQGGDAQAIRFSAPFNESKENYDFSFSGIKTKVINYIHTAAQRGEAVNKADVAASFQAEAVSVLCEKAVRAAKQWGVARIALAGGVSANGRLRTVLQAEAAKASLECFLPQLVYCTDNAAMIGCQGYFMLRSGRYSTLELNAQANLQLV